MSLLYLETELFVVPIDTDKIVVRAFIVSFFIQFQVKMPQNKDGKQRPALNTKNLSFSYSIQFFIVKMNKVFERREEKKIPLYNLTIFAKKLFHKSVYYCFIPINHHAKDRRAQLTNFHAISKVFLGTSHVFLGT